MGEQDNFCELCGQPVRAIEVDAQSTRPHSPRRPTPRARIAIALAGLIVLALGVVAFGEALPWSHKAPKVTNAVASPPSPSLTLTAEQVATTACISDVTQSLNWVLINHDPASIGSVARKFGFDSKTWIVMGRGLLANTVIKQDLEGRAAAQQYIAEQAPIGCSAAYPPIPAVDTLLPDRAPDIEVAPQPSSTGYTPLPTPSDQVDQAYVRAQEMLEKACHFTSKDITGPTYRGDGSIFIPYRTSTGDHLANVWEGNTGGGAPLSHPYC